MKKWTLNQVRYGLTKRAEAEWAALKVIDARERAGEATVYELNEQRARWAAWDSAARFACGYEAIRTVSIYQREP
jgi:hypothetical protein